MPGSCPAVPRAQLSRNNHAGPAAEEESSGEEESEEEPAPAAKPAKKQQQQQPAAAAAGAKRPAPQQPAKTPQPAKKDKSEQQKAPATAPAKVAPAAAGMATPGSTKEYIAALQEALRAVGGPIKLAQVRRCRGEAAGRALLPGGKAASGGISRALLRPRPPCS